MARQDFSPPGPPETTRAEVTCQGKVGGAYGRQELVHIGRGQTVTRDADQIDSLACCLIASAVAMTLIVARDLIAVSMSV